jgi:hypothetical protein
MPNGSWKPRLREMLVPSTFYSLKILSSKIFVYARTRWDLALYNAPVVLLDGLVSQIWKTQLCVILRRKLEIPDLSKIYFEQRTVMYGTLHIWYFLHKVHALQSPEYTI